MTTTRIITRCLLVAVLLWTVSAMAQAPATIFQLNGDPANDNLTCVYGTPCDYWDLINQSGSSGTGRGHSAINSFVLGTATTESFTGGGSKDPNDLNQWAWSGGPTPNKDTLLAGYAAAYNISDFDVIFGADRLSPNGDANIGIWFFQESVCTGNTGNFVVCGTTNVAHHVNGDVLVLSAFTGGGGTSTVAVYKWDSSCSSGVKNPQNGDCAAAHLRQLFNSSSVCGSAAACGVTNGSTVSASWASYSSGSIASPLFFEGGVDITSLFPGGSQPCFASFLEETRSSQSPTAVLKDFLLGGFPVCGMSITKNCGTTGVSSDGTSFVYPVNGVVTNTGIGNLYNVAVQDCINGPNNTCTPTGNSPISVTNNTVVNNVNSPNFGTSTLGPGETGTWSDSSTSSATSQSDQAYAIAAETPNGSQTLQSTNTASTTCTAQANSTLTVSKSCSTSLTTSAAVQVSYGGLVCNTGPSQVTGIALTDYPNSVAITNGTNGTVVKSGITLGPGTTNSPTCVPYGPYTYNPTAVDETINGGTGAGRYYFDDLVTISSATPSVGTLTQFQNTNPNGANYNPDARINGTYGFGTARCPICDLNECPVAGQ